MDLTGEYRIPAPRETVWAALNNPDILRACIPGCEELNKTSDSEFVARVIAKIGPVKAGFNGKVRLSDLDPPAGYTITGEGQGGAAGFAKGGAKVRLETVDGGAATVLYYAADAQIGGKLAQIGSRLVEGTARKLADEFFAAFAVQAAAIAPAAAEVAPAAAEPAPPSPPVAQPVEAPSRGLSPVVWIVGLVVIIAIILGFVALR
ncbi:SRPBCC family protein [Dongia deserti]|uniref:SRPBCC family protein n=1 Tax=Dongia deserti TaxID=2268030 RepID=UPI000E65B05A|nr:carbon monoxide dehydrogenase subunit G [Dongia deserti]